MAKKEKEMEGEEKGEGGEKGKKRKFRILYPLMRDGKTFKIGDVEEFNLSEIEETRLVGQSLEEVE